MKTFSSLIDGATSSTLRNDSQIRKVISQIVPANTMAHIQFCRVEGGRLRITVDSSAWVSRLRFSERQIIDVLREKRFDTHTISYHVTPAERPAVRKTVRCPTKSIDSARSLEQTAEALTGDENNRLRLELLKLARQLRDS